MRKNPISGKRRELITKQLLARLPKLRQEPPEEIALLVRSVVDAIGEADPTDSGAYAPWAVERWIKGELRFPEDVTKLRETLTAFDSVKRRLPPEDRDIGGFKTYASLAAFIKPFLGPSGLKTGWERKLAVAHSDDAKEIASFKDEGHQYVIYRVGSAKTTTQLAAGTEWCVRDKEWADDYLEKGPFFFIDQDDQPWRLLHFGKDIDDTQFKDPLDKDPDDDDARKELGLIEDYLKKEVGKKRLCPEHGNIIWLNCPSCDHKSCYECFAKCRGEPNRSCKQKICWRCRETCGQCHDDFCESHIGFCMRCEQHICADCTTKVVDIHGEDAWVCEDCFEECESCKEKVAVPDYRESEQLRKAGLKARPVLECPVCKATPDVPYTLCPICMETCKICKQTFCPKHSPASGHGCDQLQLFD